MNIGTIGESVLCGFHTWKLRFSSLLGHVDHGKVMFIGSLEVSTFS
jgi:hypothetical protein